MSGSIKIIHSVSGQQIEVPIKDQAIDAQRLQELKVDGGGDGKVRPGLMVLDESFRNTAAVKSKISHLDPVKGTLQYRQYLIEDLFRKYSFENNVSLLVWGSLPSATRRAEIQRSFASQMRAVSPTVLKVIESFDRSAPTMTIIQGGLAAAAAQHPSLNPVVAGEDIYGGPGVTPVARDVHIYRTLAVLGVVVAMTYCHQHQLPFVPPSPEKSYVQNLLSMMSFSMAEEQTVGLEALLLLHAEHGMCNATAAFLHVASTHADPIACLQAALAAIYGPLHGGSNIVTYHQLQRIATPKNVPHIIAQTKARKHRLYGFGHRIYRTIDPRATLLREYIEELQQRGKGDKQLLEVALQLNAQVESDAFFVERKIKANTDLFTVLAYQALGFGEDLVFPMICISRAQGFLAHWKEFMDSNPPVWRPQQIYTGLPPAQQQRSMAVAQTASKL